MNSGIASLEQAYHILFMVFLVILAIMFFACLIRAVIGPRMADRIVAVNMMGTMVMVAIVILAGIREKIEYDTAKPQYIETIWGVGYRFKV